MAQGKNTVKVYRDWLDNFEDLSDEELGQLMRHFFQYINDKDPILSDRVLKVAWRPIEASLKRDLTNWKKRVEVNKNNGSKGGRPPKPKQTQKTHSVNSQPKKADKDKDKDKDKDRDKDRDKEKINSSTSPKKNSGSPPKEKIYSAEVKKLFNEFLPLFPERIRPITAKQVDDWLDTLDKLIRLDGFTSSEIDYFVRKAREDRFWSKNFLSVLKLRQKKDGISYATTFLLQFPKPKESYGTRTGPTKIGQKPKKAPVLSPKQFFDKVFQNCVTEMDFDLRIQDRKNQNAHLNEIKALEAEKIERLKNVPND